MMVHQSSVDGAPVLLLVLHQLVRMNNGKPLKAVSRKGHAYSTEPWSQVIPSTTSEIFTHEINHFEKPAVHHIIVV